MSVLIRGMEMPTSPVLFCIHPDGKVFADLEGNWQEYTAVPVPPHGDLIDYDFCMENYELLHDDDGNPVYAVRMRGINNAPTIIPASEEEDRNVE